LLKEGANPNVKNLWNSTPASIAIKKGHFKILEIIVAHIQGG